MSLSLLLCWFCLFVCCFTKSSKRNGFWCTGNYTALRESLISSAVSVSFSYLKGVVILCLPCRISLQNIGLVYIEGYMSGVTIMHFKIFVKIHALTFRTATSNWAQQTKPFRGKRTIPTLFACGVLRIKLNAFEKNIIILSSIWKMTLCYKWCASTKGIVANVGSTTTTTTITF